MGRPSNKEERKQQIIDGLKIAMAENGYEKASIHSIAKAAGLSPGLIHYHFKTKLNILVALINQLNESSNRRFENKIEGVKNPAVKLNAYIESSLGLGEGADQNAVAAWVVISAEAVRQEEVRKIYQEIIKENLRKLELIITDLKIDKNLEVNDKVISELASLILSTITGSFQLATTCKGLLPKDYASKTLKELVKGLI